MKFKYLYDIEYQNAWIKLQGGVVPKGYECKFFLKDGLMIRKIKNSKYG